MTTSFNLKTVEIKAFVPAQDYEISKAFYEAIGFRMASTSPMVSYFHAGSCAFLLQSFYVKEFAENLMMHLLVESADDWRASLVEKGIDQRFGVRIGPLEDQPWAMRDFVLHDPSGVLWRIGHNLPRPG